MNNKFENENEEENSLKSASLIEHFMRTLDRISVSLNIAKAILRFWENAHLPLPWANINTYFSLKAKCCLRGGVGGQFPRNVKWSQKPCIRFAPVFI